MAERKDKEPMQTSLPPLPLPHAHDAAPTHSLQCDVPEELFEAVRKEAKQRRLSMKSVVIWGLKAYLKQTNASAAARLQDVE